MSADNTTNGSDLTAAGIISGKSYGIMITNSGYGAWAYLEVSNGVDITNIYSTVTTNYLKLYITNTSVTNDNTNDDKVVRVRVQIPWSVDTNTLTVTNLVRTHGVTNYITNGYIVMDYAASNMQVGESDVYWLTYADTVMNISTNAVWGMDAAYNSTYNQYKPASVWPGEGMTVQYTMPAVNAKGYANAYERIAG